MKINLYSVLDSASGVNDGPVGQHNDNVALRNFKNLAENPDTPVGKNPEHFSLWYIGQYNDSTAELLPDTKRCLCHAIDLINDDLSVNDKED